MKKIGTYFFVFIISVVIFLLGFNYKSTKQPFTYYQVYLDSELIGMIESKEELEDYINTQASTIRDNVRSYTLKNEAIITFQNLNSTIDLSSYNNDKDKAKALIDDKDSYNLSDIDVENLNYYIDNKVYEYSSKEIEDMKEYIKTNNIYQYVNNVYTPNGIKIKKIYTYHKDIMSVPEIYKIIISKKSCTIAGYKFTIKKEGQEDLEIYTLDRKVFNEAIDNLINIFVSEDKYNAYKKDMQTPISTLGSVIENIYVEEDITYKAVNISVDDKIYTNPTDLSAYLLYGEDHEEKVVLVQSGDSIESVAFNNQISVEEFLISNKKYTNRNNLIAPGTEVIISKINPKVRIVVETYEVSDKETGYTTVEQYDETLTQGSMVVSQNGENGIERVSQNIKSINGEIAYVDPVDKKVIKSATPKIINIGTKYVPNVGSTTSWGWTTDSGYTLSSYFGYRPMTFGSTWHSGLDIAGTGYGSNIYAANNGVVINKEYNGSYGYYIMLDHHNGYYSLYGHMSRFADGISVGSTVSRGQVIGYVGTSGNVTGPHLHFEIRTCQSWSCATNPLRFY